MHAIMLAALALACVCSPAMAMGLLPAHGREPSDVSASLAHIGTLICLAVLAMHFVGILSRRIVVGAIIAACAFFSLPSLGVAETVTVNGQPAVILPWGDQIAALAVALREPILTVLLPIIAGYIIQAIRKVYPWAALFLTQRRVEMMLEAAVGYGLNAVQGATRGKMLSVDVAVPVIAKGTQYVIDTAPPAVIKAAGGKDGIAARMFRKLELDEHGSETTVLVPAVEQIERFPPPTLDELRDAERMSRG